MGMGGGHAIGTRRVNRRVNGEGGGVDQVFALDNLSFGVDQDQVRDANLAEIHSEWIDPEMVEHFRVARGDVSRHAFIKPEFGEEAECGGQSLFSVQPLLLDRIESRRLRQIERTGRVDRWCEGSGQCFWHILLLQGCLRSQGSSLSSITNKLNCLGNENLTHIRYFLTAADNSFYYPDDS